MRFCYTHKTLFLHCELMFFTKKQPHDPLGNARPLKIIVFDGYIIFLFFADAFEVIIQSVKSRIPGVRAVVKTNLIQETAQLIIPCLNVRI